MANDVFDNGREVSCKKGDGKSICAFPDVCMTPPENPATPPGVPVPYPNTGMAKDMTSGSKKVKISGKEVMLKNKSYFKKSIGDEAGSAAKKGVVTSVNRGKVYFISWSMDVKVEGQNVVRHLDMTTHNHASPTTNTVPWAYTDSAMLAEGGDCDQEYKKEQAACSGKTPSQACKDTKCQKARKCMLVPYGGKGSPNCCPPQVAHHVLPNSLLQATRGDSSTNVSGLRKTGQRAYTEENGPSVCCTGKEGVSNPIGTHKKMHDKTKKKLQGILEAGETLTFDDSVKKSAEAHSETFRDSDGKPQCRKKCIEAQLNAHFERCGTGAEIKVRQKDGATTADYSKYKLGGVG